ncbi:hypothetical protein PTSG_09166 [Salpingoeca rosetta]|uniref:Protein tweety homolog n=1 Tax=Salpingoeca rosetta (strain ATCC 50818 / BSB-021) TaxID=946362 RepID=F2UMX2_SALR5|nr:uncharacterized protein PTSG_09166 [Salpingoeca rosetta]EGD78471.1 hypothetical protein PTSG_09166 [Salpingoeca rosetta]|eukprot:XP_004989420.1 hypothetical protein PTSG_09166 [Salpingoeca rosetta]
MAAARLFLLATLCVCAVAMSAANAADDSTYTPGKQVKRWTTNNPLTDQNELVSYAQDVGVKRVAPVIVIGVLCFIGILIWSCCRCCGKCRLESTDQCCSFSLGGLLICCSIAGLALIIVGLEASKDQDTAFNNVPTVVDSAVQWVDDLGAQIDGLLVLTGELVDIGDMILAADNGTGIVDNSTITSLKDASSVIEDASTAVDDLAAQAGIEDFRDSFASDGAFACLVSAALVGVMTGLSDVCINPDASIIGLAEVTDPTITFFIQCDDDTSLDNPFADDTADLTDGFDSAQTAVLDLRDEINNSTECTQFNVTQCSTLSTLLLDANSTLGELNTAIGADSLDANGNADEGVLQLVSCSELNGRYQLVLNVLCGDAAEALGKSTEVLLGFAVLYVVVLVLTRLLTDVGVHQTNNNKIAPADTFDENGRQPFLV